MNKHIETIRKTRAHLLNLIADLSVEQLNEIPAGFNNNIIWNVSHLIASQQGVCYVRAGLKTFADEQFFQKYKADTRPGQPVDAAEVANIKQMFLSAIDQLETDYHKNVFAGYTPWTTRYGVELKNIDEAIAFLPFHEGMHAGYIMALKRIVKSRP